MLKPVQGITEKANKNIRAKYNEIYGADVKQGYFTEEDKERLEQVKKKNVIHLIYEYELVERYINRKAKHANSTLTFQIIPLENNQYKVNYYSISYLCDYYREILQGDKIVTKNELEAFYYYHSKRYGKIISVENSEYGVGISTDIFALMNDNGDHEFCVIGDINLSKIKSLNNMMKSEQFKDKCKTLK